MIEVQGVTKRYGDFTAVDDVSFVARQGRVTGFLGPNGAGKSTTMRIMVGLTPATSGRVTIGGRQVREIPNPGRMVGVLLDASAQHDGRTGREVLGIAAQTMGVPDGRVEEMLDLVGLSGAEGRRRVGKYSLGMRQRLGIAVAMIGDPQVLVLDEPANGLDPAGIRWMRELLAGFADRGGTVLLSSHLLHEVEQVADDLVLIGRGHIVAQGTKAELASSRGGVRTLVDAVPEDRARLGAALEAAGLQVQSQPEGLVVQAEPASVGRIAFQAGVPLVGLAPQGNSFEDLFLELTAATQRDAVPGVPVNQAGAVA